MYSAGGNRPIKTRPLIDIFPASVQDAEAPIVCNAIIYSLLLVQI